MPGLGFTNAFEAEILEWLFDRVQMDTPPTQLQVRLHTGDPGEDGTSNLLAETNGYTHQTVSTDVNNSTHTNWNAQTTDGSDNTVVSNLAEINFGTASSSWNSGNAITHVSLRDVSNSRVVAVGTIAGGTGVIVLTGSTLLYRNGDFQVKVQ